MRSAWSLRSTLGVLLATCLILVSSLPALAVQDNIFKTSNTTWNCADSSLYCRTDNATLVWFDEATISVTGRSNINSVLEGQFEPTTLTVSFTGSPVYTGSGETDIIYRQGTIQGGYLGLTICDDAISSTQCDQHYVTLSMSTPFLTLICHESGHAVGLTHGDNAAPAMTNQDSDLQCMRKSVDSLMPATLGLLNVGQINGAY
jgi:hypothetical protein